MTTKPMGFEEVLAGCAVGLHNRQVIRAAHLAEVDEKVALAEARVAISVWEIVLAFCESGTPVDGINEIAKQNVKNLRALAAENRAGESQ